MDLRLCATQLVVALQLAYLPTVRPHRLNLKQIAINPQSFSMYPYGQPPNNNPNQQPNNNIKPSVNPYPFQQPQFVNQGFHNPQTVSFAQNRNVYASTIQTSTSSNSLTRPAGTGLGKLQSMGRVIKEEPDPVIHRVQEAPSSFQNHTNHLSMGNERSKLASSVIFQKNVDDDLNRFPGFNVSNNTGTSRLDAMFAKKQQAQKDQPVPESAEERRKREINSIKQEFEFLNKRMENTGIKKNDGETKPYFQLPSRKTAVHNNPLVQNSVENSKPTFQLNSNNNEAPSTNEPANKSFFQSYSKAPIDNAITKPLVVPQNLQTDSKSFQMPIASNPVKNEGGGMFKKKNPYASQQVVNNGEQGPKTLMLSPKGAANNYGFKAQPITVKNEGKAAEVIEPALLTKKGMKRTGSVQKVQGPKVFKKSDFAIGKKMGKGQFGEVMLVQHKETGFLCGMKVMSKKQIREEKYVNQIARQLSIQFYLNHRNVAPLYGYFEDQENVYLLIEYCTGGQLLQMLRKSHRMEQADTSPIIRQICEGLDYIHKEEIIHRDIKPENILFNFNTVKICDFGWAVHCGSGMRKTVSGSPLYYSPEVVQETEYDQKVDIWAIGMMTYQCILGKIPFRIYSELDLNRIVQDEVKFPEYIDVTDDAKDFILGIMQKNPDDRMVMKDIFKHPFIRKYLNQRKLAPEIMEEFRRVLN